MDWFLYDNGLRHERVNPLMRATLALNGLKNLFLSFMLRGHTFMTSTKKTNFSPPLSLTIDLLFQP